MKELQSGDKDAFDLLLLISKNVQDNQVDSRKFITLKQAVNTFMN